MTSTLRPGRIDDLLEILRWAATDRIPLEIVGSGTRSGVGRPVQAEYTLSLSGMAGVTLYEPDELVLSARPGTPLSEIEAVLAAHGQELAFEPLGHAVLAGVPFRAGSDRGTFGGMFGANASGPRRIKAGACRDHVLGVEAVSGRGEAFKSGGRVVKNVTGYDLPRGLAGSWGTLAVITALTVKVLPKAENVQTILVSGLSDEAGIAALCAAMGSAAEVSGAAHLPPAVASDQGLAGLFEPAGAQTLMRLEGFAPSVAYRAAGLAGLMKDYGTVDRIGTDQSAHLWRAIRDASPFAGSQTPVWRVSVAPASGPAVVAALRATAGGDAFRHYYDWSGGLVWIELADGAGGPDAAAATVRAAVKAAGGGHATLVRGTPALRAAVPPFEPQEAALAALTRRLKAGFDPLGILNPGRMAADL